MKKSECQFIVLTRDNSNMIKGIAVLMMIMHHLWAFPERIPNMELSNIFIQVGAAAKICVSIFMFLSGYGLYFTFCKKGTIQVGKRILRIYERFWQAFIIFVPLGFILSKPFLIEEFLLNFFCLKFSYNHEWWFMGTYIELLLIFPIVMLTEKKRYFPYLLLLSVVVLRLMSAFINLDSGEVYKHLCMFCYYCPSFFLGVFFCKYSLFKRFCSLVLNNFTRSVLCLLSIFLLFIIRVKWNITEMTILMTPLFVFVFSYMLDIIDKVRPFFLLLGKHSMNMWLVHTFFCYYYFQYTMLLISDNPIFLYMLLVIVSLLSSMFINLIWNMACLLKQRF